MSEVLADSTLPDLLTATLFSPLRWFHSLSATLLGRCLRALVSPISWGLQHNLGFTFTSSCDGLSRPHALRGPSFRDCPGTQCPVLAASLKQGRGFHSQLILLYVLQESTARYGGQYLLEMEPASFLCCCFVRVKNFSGLFFHKPEGSFVGEVSP
jgi:hypothetical protein